MISIRNITMALLLYSTCYSTYASDKELIVAVEQTAGTVGFYDADGKKYASVHVGFLPHEVAISNNKKTAYVSNFGLQDYDETIGVAGVSISVIDIPNHIEKYRLYTFDPSKSATFSQIDKAPHAVRLRPPLEKLLYVNVEKGNKILIFDVNSRKIISKIDVNPHTHNFIFSPDGKVLWLMAGRDGVIRMDPDTGKITGQLRLTTPIRGLIYTPDNRYIMASGDNEIFLLNPENLTVSRHFYNLGVGQILYSDMTPDKRYIIAPAVWDSQVIIIDTATGKVIKRVVTGLDPVSVKLSDSGRFAYVTNARDDYVTEINLKTFQTKKILTANGPNGLAITKFISPGQHKTLTLGVPLPLSGKYGSKGREMMLGYELWISSIRQAGGLIIRDIPYDIKIIYLDTQSNNSFLGILTKELIAKNHINILLGTYGEEAYKIEKEIAINNNIPIAPLRTQAFEWQPGNIASGEDYFITTNMFAQDFKLYYNLNATWLSAAAAESVDILQQALLQIDSYSYDLLMDAFSRNNFQTFLSSLKNVDGSNHYAS